MYRRTYQSLIAIVVVIGILVLIWRVRPGKQPNRAADVSFASAEIVRPAASDSSKGGIGGDIKPRAPNIGPPASLPLSRHSPEPEYTRIEQEVKEQAVRLRQSSTNTLITTLRELLSRLKSNNPPSQYELALTIEELRRRQPENFDLEVLERAMDLDHRFGRAPVELAKDGERLFNANPEHPLTSGLLIYGLMARGFDYFTARINEYTIRYPDNPDFQYAAAAIDLAKQQPSMAKQRLRDIVNTYPQMEKAATSLNHLEQGEVEVDSVMDFNPRLTPKDLDSIFNNLPASAQ